MMITNIDVRPSTSGDSHHLLNIDNKVSEFPWDVEDWQLLNHFQGWKVWVVTINKTPKGFCVVENDTEDDVARIHKWIVLPEGKKIGADLLLLDMVEYDAVVSSVGTIEFVVPETACQGSGDPYDISADLLSQGFLCEERQEAMYEAYGEEFDGFMFRKPVHCGKFL